MFLPSVSGEPLLLLNNYRCSIRNRAVIGMFQVAVFFCWVTHLIFMKGQKVANCNIAYNHYIKNDNHGGSCFSFFLHSNVNCKNVGCIIWAEAEFLIQQKQKLNIIITFWLEVSHVQNLKFCILLLVIYVILSLCLILFQQVVQHLPTHVSK